MKTTFISMLRGINVGGKNRSAMPALKALYESLGFTHVVTYVQSGNVVFDSDEGDAARTAHAIEEGIAQTLGLSLPVILRDESCLRRVIANHPFAARSGADPTRLHVTFLSAAPSDAALDRLVVPTGCTDEFAMEDKEIYLFCPNGYGVTKLSNNFFEKKLGLAATTRNWKTVHALLELAQDR